MTEFIASFDIGKKNFAFIVEEIDTNIISEIKNVPKKNRYNIDGTCKPEFQELLNTLYTCGKIVLSCNLDITYDCDSKKYLDPKLYYNMFCELDKYKEYWDKCSTILIERQMSFKNKRNVMAVKLGQNCYSYFLLNYKLTKQIIDYPAYYKTQILGAPKKFGKISKTYKNGKTVEIQDNRKKWAIRIANDVLTLRNDTETLSKLTTVKKKDDMSDCLLMNITYLYLHYLDKKKF